MRRFRQGLLFIAVLIAIAASALWALAWPGRAEAAQTGQRLRVVTKALPPFVFVSPKGDVSGFSIQVWEEIARRANLEFEYNVVETVGDQLAAVENGEADLAIAGITITAERESRVDFSQPFFDSGLQIVARVGGASPVQELMAAIFSPALLQFLVFFMALVLVIAHLVWLTERGRGNFAMGYVLGISQALWWSAVTAIGYDDR